MSQARETKTIRTAITLRKIAERRGISHNDTISIMDIFVQSTNKYDRFGETQSTESPLEETTTTRTAQQITLFMDLANNEHLKRLTGSQKKDGNKITRLTTHEFWFYPKNPLTEDKFKLLTDKIISIAGNHPHNLHLCLATFPILLENGIVINGVFYIECGPSPKINWVVKRMCSLSDIEYPETSNYKQLEDSETNGLNTTDLLANPIDKNGNIYATHNSIIVSTTAKGTKFIIALDICLEHKLGVGKNALIEYIKKTAPTNSIPTLINYIITSNWVDLYEPFGSYITHADPKKGGSYIENDGTYSKLKLEKISTDITGPFGAPFVLHASQETKICPSSDDVTTEITKHNERAQHIMPIGRFLDKDIYNEEKLRELAATFFENGEYLFAFYTYEILTITNPSDSDLYFSMGDCLSTLGRSMEARKIMMQGMKSQDKGKQSSRGNASCRRALRFFESPNTVKTIANKSFISNFRPAVAQRNSPIKV